MTHVGELCRFDAFLKKHKRVAPQVGRHIFELFRVDRPPPPLQQVRAGDNP